MGFLRRGRGCAVRQLSKAKPATDSEITDDDIIFRYDDKEVIGIAILHASQC